jgi:pimeloyl-ACP methyl ester carboxylesterase
MNVRARRCASPRKKSRRSAACGQSQRFCASSGFKMIKPHILLLHGGPGMDCDYFFPYFSSLESDFELFYYRQKANTINALINELSDQIKASSATSIIAHSWGAFLLLVGMASKPDIFSSLKHAILISPMPLTAARCVQAMNVIQSRFSDADSALYHELKNKTDAKSADIIKLLLPYYHFDRSFVMPIPYFDRVKSKTINDQLGDFDNRAHVACLPRSTLVIYGSADYTGPESEYSDLDGVTIKIIQNAGHFSFAERPKIVVPYIRDFIK